MICGDIEHASATKHRASMCQNNENTYGPFQQSLQIPSQIFLQILIVQRGCLGEHQSRLSWLVQVRISLHSHTLSLRAVPEN